MAFVVRSDRKATHINQPVTGEVGPGAYFGHEELQNDKNFCAFNSNEVRAKEENPITMVV